jgi:WD40 repeat protein
MVLEICFSLTVRIINGKLVAAEYLTVRFWDVDMGAAYGRVKGLSGVINKMGFSLDERLLAADMSDMTICLWDLKMKELNGS